MRRNEKTFYGSVLSREVIVEEAEPATTDDLDVWYRELQLLGPAQYEPGEREQVEAVLNDADEQAKSLVRREMGLDRSRF